MANDPPVAIGVRGCTFCAYTGGPFAVAAVCMCGVGSLLTSVMVAEMVGRWDQRGWEGRENLPWSSLRSSKSPSVRYPTNRFDIFPHVSQLTSIQGFRETCMGPPVSHAIDSCGSLEKRCAT